MVSSDRSVFGPFYGAEESQDENIKKLFITCDGLE